MLPIKYAIFMFFFYVAFYNLTLVMKFYQNWITCILKDPYFRTNTLESICMAKLIKNDAKHRMFNHKILYAKLTNIFKKSIVRYCNQNQWIEHDFRGWMAKKFIENAKCKERTYFTFYFLIIEVEKLFDNEFVNNFFEWMDENKKEYNLKKLENWSQTINFFRICSGLPGLHYSN